MADGNVVLEHQFATTDVKRDAHTWGVDERASWLASDSDLGGLKRIADAKDVVVRLTGSKGYATVPKDDVKGMKEDFKTVLATLSVLDSATASRQPTECK